MSFSKFAELCNHWHPFLGHFPHPNKMGCEFWRMMRGNKRHSLGGETSESWAASRQVLSTTFLEVSPKGDRENQEKMAVVLRGWGRGAVGWFVAQLKYHSLQGGISSSHGRLLLPFPSSSVHILQQNSYWWIFGSWICCPCWTVSPSSTLFPLR